MMMFFYSFALSAAALLTAPVWGWRMMRQGRYREGFRERLGTVPARLRRYIEGKPVIWLHAVSVGETLAATRLTLGLRAALPAYAVVISTTTPTGQRVARERFGGDSVFFYPVDFAFAVRAYLLTLQPRIVILMESELWPRMIFECVTVRIPVAVVNARVSDRSLPRYLRLRTLWRPLLQRVTLLLAQSNEDARRWQRIGAPAERVHSIGNLKFDVIAADATPLAALIKEGLPPTAKVLVCGSTHDGEDAILLHCWQQLSFDNAVMILAPRHPERTGSIEQLATASGIETVRLSQWRIAPSRLAPGSILLVDTVGELAALYSLAQAAFIGGSLVPHGGQNPLEAARFGVPLLMGPSYENFMDVVHGLTQAGLLTHVTEASLCETLRSRLEAAPDPASMETSRTFFQAQSGGTTRAITALLQP